MASSRAPSRMAQSSASAPRESRSGYRSGTITLLAVIGRDAVGRAVGEIGLRFGRADGDEAAGRDDDRLGRTAAGTCPGALSGRRLGRRCAVILGACRFWRVLFASRAHARGMLRAAIAFLRI